jgi:tetratricopeptide (TPR) repeat protein
MARTWALELASDGGDTRDRGETLLGMAHYALKLGRYNDSVSCAERCMAIGRTLEDTHLIGSALTIAGAGLHAASQPSRAIACYNEACEVLRLANDTLSLSAAVNGIAEIHRDAGSFLEADTFYEESIDLARVGNDGRRCATTLCNLASLLIAAGKLDRARAVLVEGLGTAIAIDDRSQADWTVDVVAALAAASADYPVAARFHGATHALMQEAGTRHEPVDEAFIEGWIAKAREAMGAVAYDAAEAEGRALSYTSTLAAVNRWLAAPA